MAFDAGLADRIPSLLPRDKPFTERRMFGGLAFLYNAHMVCGLMKADLMLRLGDAGAAAALKHPHTRPMDYRQATQVDDLRYGARRGFRRIAGNVGEDGADLRQEPAAEGVTGV